MTGEKNKWINDIKDEKSQSTALMARRKMGKTALMERLFNITFYKNDGVIPFYYEVKETKMWNRGINDNIFDKVFRGVYDEEIRKFDSRVIRNEYNVQLKKANRQYKRLLGKLSYQKGYHAEFLILNQLLYHASKNNELLKSVTRYLPDDFDFRDYSRVWKYHSSPEYAKVFSVDIFARSLDADDYSIIGEVKNREVKKFSLEEIKEFELKFAEIKKRENLKRVVGFIFSRSGFTTEAEAYCKEKGIACSEDDLWLETGKLKSPVV